jgi:hypothetical protein
MMPNPSLPKVPCPSSRRLLARQMESFGDLKLVTFNELVVKETGHVYRSRCNVEEWSEDEEE